MRILHALCSVSCAYLTMLSETIKRIILVHMVVMIEVKRNVDFLAFWKNIFSHAYIT